MADTLSLFWRKWRDKRRQEIEQTGYAPELAEMLATRDAEARKEVAKVAGKTAALRCDVITNYRPDGTYGVYAQVEKDHIPQKYRQSAYRFAARGRPKQNK
ncbi:MAG: hypothetical protein P0Y65_13765 [Candidatus Devosia phytovorans]|uniref:Uncharacterized protein n=1 Tax=Candidatus Devosia phytovorans TaxID=3121372 RepID=A0AAJ5VTW8_9HYPH|nr:hypothetical protein [Devosia sp.]WEK03259.1 MAG: hypothetical protein P0Y65_13765 [Devosia sp.]